jgi:tRNA(fMet)-specific endonuclease VapC
VWAVIDTNVAILLRDGDRAVSDRIAALEFIPLLSVLSRVELEGGVYRDRAQTAVIRPRVDVILRMVEQVPFTEAEAEVYGEIVKRCGFSRPRIIDRMIAATAITQEAGLITLNPRDFRDIPGLTVEDWTAAPI